MFHIGFMKTVLSIMHYALCLLQLLQDPRGWGTPGFCYYVECLCALSCVPIWLLKEFWFFLKKRSSDFKSKHI
jgi:hypothetical protein